MFRLPAHDFTLNRAAAIADRTIVPPKTRLDVVVKLRERDERNARLELANAQRALMAAERALVDAMELAQHDARGSGRAVDWELADAAHARALHDARQAERAALAASDHLGSSRKQFHGARARAEAMRRTVDARRAEVARDAEAAERKTLDELAMLLHGRT